MMHHCTSVLFALFHMICVFIDEKKSYSSKVVPDRGGLSRPLEFFLTRCNSSLFCTSISVVPFRIISVIVLRYSGSTSVSKKHLHFRCAWLFVIYQTVSGFLNLSTIDILGPIILFSGVGRSVPMHWRAFGSFQGFY